ncbi:MAG: sensor histidine kinase [Ginsengibacter sp.]
MTTIKVLQKQNNQLKEKLAAKAKEVKIETSLEKVRAIALRMKEPSDMLKICRTICLQLEKLGVEEIRNVQTAIFYPSKGSYMNYEFYARHDKTLITDTVYTNHKIAKAFAKKIMEGKGNFYITNIKGAKVQEWLTYQKTTNVFIDKYLKKASSLNYYWYSLGPVALGISTYAPLSKENQDLFKRFLRVFELAYRRYLDIEKAQAQAREARVEAALEKVRSRSMAMHKSDELKEVIRLVLEQFIHLNIKAEHAGFYIDYKAHDDMHIWLADPNLEPFYAVIPYFDTPTWNSFLEAKAKGIILHTDLLDFKTKNKFYNSLFQLFTVPGEVKKFYLGCKGLAVSTVLLENVGLYIENFSAIPYSEEENNILIRFGKVFQQTYTRFLDLQKAEAQAREAEIGLALERVRARTMAMQKSEELQELVHTVLERLKDLNVEFYTAIIILFKEDSKDITWWLENKEKQQYARVLVPFTNITYLRDLFVTRKNGRDHFSKVYSFQEKNELFQHLFSATDFKHVPEKQRKFLLESEAASMSVALAKNTGIHLTRYTDKAFSEADNEILKRFAKVFEQAYTRFLDLQKAEDQAREAQVQLALERVRARTMAMQKSDELSEAVYVLFQQFRELGENPDQATIGIINEKEKVIEYWVTMYGEPINKVFKFSIEEPNVTKKIFKAWKQGKRYLVIDLKGKALKEFMLYRAGKGGAAVKPGEKRRIIHVAFFSKGLLIVQSTIECSAESTGLLERFASVFEQTYTRFLDLKRAEAQAREAQIEEALERVRARAMAMHASQELKEIALELRKQMGLLGQKELETCAIHLYAESPDYFQSWAALGPPNKEGEIVQRESRFPKRGVKIIEEMMECYQSNKQDYVLINDGAKAQEFFEMVKQHSGKVFEVLSESFKGLAQEDIKAYWSVADFKGGSLVMTTMVEPEEMTRALLRRFANVFGLAYRRFMDLKQAEAQAREATIEAALEKVRGKAMAMHNSNDVAITASMVFTELRKLGIRPIRCGVGLLSNESRKAGLYSATSSTNEDSLSLIGWVQLEKHPVLEKIYESWLRQGDYFPELEGEQLISYYKLLLAGLAVPVPDFSNEQKQFGHFISFSIGCLYAWSETPYKPEQINILKRFAGIIDLTFRRYLELQQSEANAKEAVRQAVLDRIRADIASMRTTADLNRIIPLVWNELTILGLPFIRCGVFIMDNEHQLIHTFLSTPEGRAIAAFKIPYDTPGKIKMIPINWKNNTAYVDHWNDSDFTDFANTLLQQEVIDSAGEYLAGVPHGGFYLHFLPFLQGMMYVGNTTELNDEELSLVQSVADAFSTAYARYEDFNKLEEAKKQVDKTLVELKQTQQQLVQSEKMASLGELTAGIAHEIQNPLNFVNNFSEVSNEMVDEMKEELTSGNAQLAMDIADDIKQNLEKILHHGKRADAIVKGMLQHSRKSTGQKEPTDINALCDEYLRLSFHGSRAKDKSLNSTIETAYDESIGKINIVPQDIGRVLLNLFNNAFYAVDEKQKVIVNKENAGKNISYEPTVCVNTHKEKDRVTITVKDNGSGIPENIREKIFQPFFTTKPTGSGTGLGLSLSYDIVKAHGGEIKVKSKEGEGTEFIIDLPI